MPAIPRRIDPVPIWLDCDTGHDDAVAILLAGKDPSLELLGVSTVYGNAPLENTTYNTLAVLSAIGRSDVPVYAGASKPLHGEPTFAEHVHGETGLKSTPSLPVPTTSPTSTSITATLDAIYGSLISQPRGKPWLIAIGAMTNISLLFNAHPDLASHIGGLSIMGGVVGDNFTPADLTGPLWLNDPSFYGNMTRYAEFNIYSDPEAGQSLFANPDLSRKLVMVTLDLTHQVLATRGVRARLSRRSDTVAGARAGRGASAVAGAAPDESPGISTNTPGTETPQKHIENPRGLFVELMDYFAQAYPTKPGPPMHDPLAVAVVLSPALFELDNGGEFVGDRYSVEVVLDDTHDDSTMSQRGRTVVRRLEPGSAGVQIPRRVVDVNAIWDMIEKCLERLEN